MGTILFPGCRASSIYDAGSPDRRPIIGTALPLLPAEYSTGVLFRSSVLGTSVCYVGDRRRKEIPVLRVADDNVWRAFVPA